MEKWVMTIDIERCENCNNCFLACKDEHWDNDWLPHTLAQPRHGHRWMNILTREQGRFPHIRVAYRPTPCFHCADPPCMKKADKGEIYQRPDGIVIVDPEKSRGRKDLVSSCPHGAIWWNRENRTPQKCTLCAHLLDDGWEKPRCVQACPTGALAIEKLSGSTLDEKIRAKGLETAGGTMPPSAAQAPVVLYKNLDRFNAWFVAGSVATRGEGVESCVQGAIVALSCQGRPVARETTDAFGEFWFSGLAKTSGPYELTVNYQDKPQLRQQVEVTASSSIGTLWI